MSAERYVLLGVAPARAPWFRDVAVWAQDGTLPAEFLKCLGVEELRARLGSGRPHSAVLIDAASPGLDRDLIAAAGRARCAVIVVGDDRRDWTGAGADAVLPSRLDPAALLRALTDTASTVWNGASPVPEERTSGELPHGALVAVCGAGGTGVSTVAAALAQGISRATSRRVLLADFCRNAEQHVLHDVPDAGGGVVEVVDAHRSGAVEPRRAVASAVGLAERGYDLLPGLRRAAAWAVLRPLAVEAAVSTLRRTWDVVVCDTDADLEDEATGGSIDVEERNVLARTAVLQARCVLAVGRPGVKGTHSLARTIRDVLDAGVAATRVVPVVNGGPRHPRQRAELASVLAALLPADAHVWSPVFLPIRKVDAAWRDGALLPAPLPELVFGAYRAVAVREREVAVAGARVVPGSLGLAAGSGAS